MVGNDNVLAAGDAPAAAPPDAEPPPPPDAPAAQPDAFACSPDDEYHGRCVCTAETCAPGATRWCDSAMSCAWGQQSCGPDAAWGACVEVTAKPPGCTGGKYDIGCCLASGDCCESLDPGNNDTSLGNCPGLVKECHPTGG